MSTTGNEKQTEGGGGSTGNSEKTGRTPPPPDAGEGFSLYACCWRFEHDCPRFVYQKDMACGVCLVRNINSAVS